MVVGGLFCWGFCTDSFCHKVDGSPTFFWVKLKPIIFFLGGVLQVGFWEKKTRRKDMFFVKHANFKLFCPPVCCFGRIQSRRLNVYTPTWLTWLAIRTSPSFNRRYTFKWCIYHHIKPNRRPDSKIWLFPALAFGGGATASSSSFVVVSWILPPMMHSSPPGWLHLGRLTWNLGVWAFLVETKIPNLNTFLLPPALCILGVWDGR